MSRFLLFTLYAPLASWGDIAVGENRGSWDRPSRSALLGLLAAALGIDRNDQPAHDALDRDCGTAVRLDAAGAECDDYHTVQTASETELRRALGGRPPRDRRDVLAIRDRETVVSSRTLRQDALATAAVWATATEPRWSLEALGAALGRPAFVPYAGRKALPLGLPLAPAIVTAATLADAFRARPPVPAALDFAALQGRDRRWGLEVSHDELPADVPSGLTPLRREVRRDARPQRARWQFAERIVNIGRLDGEAGA